MAITPTRVLDVTEDESKRMKRVEEYIDQLLIKHYHPGAHVDYPISKRWRPGFIAALIRKYEQSGWSVTRVINSESDQWELRFDAFTSSCAAESS